MLESTLRHKVGGTEPGREITARLRDRFGNLPVHYQRSDLLRIEVPRPDIIPLLSYLKTETPFVQLTHLSVVDWIETNEFELIYLVTAPSLLTTLMICIRIDREKAEAESVFNLWLQAETYEQEINEMYGIHFPGSPRQGIPFILEGWNDMPPMRRDFDTVEYCRRVHPERPGRSSEDSRAYVGRAFGEKGYLK
ncbi:MAG: NADH-quinone oxidoreductase subunit C [Lysobacterales bacterium]|jgi:NADH-quinone oxidoreductase subunit C